MPTTPEGLDNRLGSWLAGKRSRAFLPPALPPDPPIRLAELQDALERANQAVGRLDGVASILPEPELFLYFYVRKEALLSSQIEGTQSSFSDLLLFEAGDVPGVPLEDVEEVSNYVAAMNRGLELLQEGLPISLRLIREVHRVLLRSGRGVSKDPGEFRRAQNWIGGTGPETALFVPPPPERLAECLDAFEKFLNNDDQRLPILVRAGLAHVQFETIHPFLDGNGRVGRLLVTLLLCADGVLREPMLYLSLYLKTHRQAYYDLLQRVRETGDWEGWLAFFLAGVRETAEQAAETARRILTLFEADRRKIEILGRPAASALRVHHALQRRPLTTISAMAGRLSVSEPTVASAIRNLTTLGIVNEVTGRKRGRTYAYSGYLDLLLEGTEPLTNR